MAVLTVTLDFITRPFRFIINCTLVQFFVLFLRLKSAKFTDCNKD